ncbi:tRNA pseudouridine synthase A isoform X2 [Eucalyptus grandis]|uniref:tRNA pseudouridine synthase A isoform X2 n=1 Tax=Eucalyptus grandis TaxID=71139 RepID=UPI00192F0C3B|nr:tRNA pseudouridine synthase A isoform X2 [Eucalyptus grandis]
MNVGRFIPRRQSSFPPELLPDQTPSRRRDLQPPTASDPLDGRRRAAGGGRRGEGPRPLRPRPPFQTRAVDGEGELRVHAQQALARSSGLLLRRRRWAVIALRAVRGREACEKSGLDSLPGGKRSGRWERRTYKIVLTYHGGSFDGWQKQPGLNTVQGSIERSLGDFVDEKKAKLLKDKSLPVEGCALVAGRTDKGVTALGQVCSFYTWRKDVEPQHIELAINTAAPGRLRAISVSEVSRSFHPNFSAKWRRYLYIFPFNDGENGEAREGTTEHVDKMSSKANSACRSNGFGNDIDNEDLQSLILSDKDEDFEGGNKQVSFEVSRVNQFLQLLEGKLLSYKMFARDTKASRNIGPPTECFLYHARAALGRLKGTDCQEGRKVMFIELVANRFLRKMVRVLVATSIREAVAGSEEDVLMKLMDSTCRRATAPPAPPDGLCLVDVGYTDFNPKTCLIKGS